MTNRVHLHHHTEDYDRDLCTVLTFGSYVRGIRGPSNRCKVIMGMKKDSQAHILLKAFWRYLGAS